MNYVNLDGCIMDRAQLKAECSLHNHSIDNGIFETILVKNALIRLAFYHWQRLFDGLKKLNIDTTIINGAFLEQEVLKVVLANKAETLCRVRLKLFYKQDYATKSNKAHFLIECFPILEEVLLWQNRGWICGLSNDFIKVADPLSHLKKSNRELYNPLQFKMAKEDWDDVFFYNQHGRIVETSIANLWWIKLDTIYTPPLSEGFVNGVMRRFIKDVLSKEGIIINEVPLTIDLLLDADEVFLSNALRSIVPIHNIKGRKYTSVKTFELFQLIQNALCAT